MGNKHSASSSSRNDNNDHLQQQRIKSKYSVIEPDDSIKVRQMFSYDRQSFELKPLEISGPFYEDSLNRLMVIPNFFSDDECRDLIKKCSNFQSLEDEYPKEHRNAMRELVTDNKLADLIFNRLKNKIDLDQIGKSIAPYGLDSRGRWVACGVNECMRFSKYEKGEYFKIHTDGQFRRSENERSIYTLLIYLNQDFNGGETKFFSDPNDDTFNLHHTLKPSVGKLALFNQDFYHEGCSVISGIKYILRTEIMYLRVDNNSIPRDNNFEQSETYQQIGQAFKESETLEKSGDVYGSSEKYFAGQRLLVKSGKTFEYLLNRQYCILEGPVENDKNDNLTVLPEEIILNIFTFLSESEICSVGLQLSRYLNHLARSPILWKAVYKKYWNGNTYLKLCEKEPLTDWYHAARVRNFTERNFKPICIDITSEVATFGFFSDETPKTTEPYVGRYTGGQ
ncbi:P4Hc domain-containing protein [Naegleria gruberi]|uniref:p4Hc domain-containing protein n=1 Tax=Naegleria gruberi TaxID=5762 RepID=D2V0H5_NAEGR|nr:P4Hc domain-containing protein [Naegleria gruberi]EFC49721.1 P4Hc domain-containing protein [Naegleria gruberi]|eukprot:XP_002682465.1 P4Hc domain-containing protein [Naegleria gruberi strain NEG-M]